MSLYAYVLAQRNFPLKRFYTLILFYTMLFSAGLVPSYIVNRQYLHLYDNFMALIVPGLVAAYNVFILRTFMQSTIPEAMFDAAKIDGSEPSGRNTRMAIVVISTFPIIFAYPFFQRYFIQGITVGSVKG